MRKTIDNGGNGELEQEPPAGVSWQKGENGERKEMKHARVDFKEIKPSNDPEIEEPNGII
jgi:hypothetical protein